MLRLGCFLLIGISATVHSQGIDPPPLALKAGFISGLDYPLAALLNRDQGETRARVMINSGGRVTRCLISQKSGSKILDDAACKLITQRFHYWPARNPQGAAIAGMRAQAIKWQLPATASLWAEAKAAKSARRGAIVGGTITDDDYPSSAIRAEQEGVVQAVLLVSAIGQVADCLVEGSSGSAILDEATCKLLIRRFRFRPAADRKGRAVPEIWHQQVKWRLPKDYAEPVDEPIDAQPPADLI